MFKRAFSLMLALCLLMSAFSIAISEEELDTVFMAAQEDDIIEEVSEEEALELGEAETAIVEDEEEGELIIEAVETIEAPEEGVEEAADEEAVEEASETPKATDGEAAEETADASEAVEEPTETPEAAEESADNEAEDTEVIAEAPVQAAKTINAAAAAAAPAQIVVNGNMKYSTTKGTTLQINLNGQTAKSYKSSKKKVATVSATGLITAVGAGKAKITITLTNKKKRTVTLTVTDPTIPTSVYLTKDNARVSGTITANRGEPITLKAVAVAAATPSTGFKWTSSKKKVASVSGGVITPKKVGTTTITVTTTRGKKKAKIKVKVVDPYKATSVSLNYTGQYKIRVKETLPLKATMKTASGKPSTSTLKWSSSNKKVATVSKSGLVTGKKKGTATITVKTSSGKKAKVKISVLKNPGAAKSMVRLSADDDVNNLDKGDEATIEVAMNPLAAPANVVWSLDNTQSVRLVETRRTSEFTYQATVRCVEIGYSYLTATDKVSGLKQQYRVVVKPPIEPTSISFKNLNSGSKHVIPKTAKGSDKKYWVEYQVLPLDSRSSDSNRAYVTVDPAIATVDYDHNNADRNCPGTMDYFLKFTPKSTGTATVTVTLKNGVKGQFTLVIE